MRYRPEIDGLRAVAILPVFLYHLEVPLFSGGFVGVDVFFVISGYLITSILMADLADGTFSLGHFYERRARRILPVFLTVMAASTAAAMVIMTPAELVDFGQTLAGAVLFVSNMVLWAQEGYFDAAAETKPLLHTWSLSVEEQFYILFPPLLWVLWRYRLQAVLVLGLIGSLGLSVYWVAERDPSLAFYAAPLRAWELLAGCLLALYRRPIRSRSGAELAAATGALMILWPVFAFSAATPFPGLAAVPPVLGTVLILQSGGGTWVGRLLSTGPFLAIGKRSYGLYMWHWPAIVLVGLVLMRDLTGFETLVLAAAIWAITLVSYRFIERPCLERRVPRPWVFGLSGAGMAAMVGVAAVVLVGQGLPGRMDPETQRIAAVADTPKPACDRVEQLSKSRSVCRIGAGEGPPRIMVWGDSHAGSWQPALDRILTEAGASGYIASLAGCPVALELARHGSGPKNCVALNARIFEIIAERRIATVLIVGSWRGLLWGGRETAFQGDPSHDDATRAANVAEALAMTIERLHGIGVRVAFLDPAPGALGPVPQAMARERLLGVRAEIAPEAGVLAAWDAKLDPGLTKVDLRIPLREVLCDARCPVSAEGAPLYHDSNHPSLALNALMQSHLARHLSPFLEGAEAVRE